MSSDSSPAADDTQANYEYEAFGGVGNNYGYTAPGNNRSNNPTDPGRGVVASGIYANEDDKPSPPAGPSPQQIALDKAKAARSDALKKKQKELKDAFGFFNEDFYNDMGQSYKDFAQGSLDTAYDDSLRGIYQGFKAKGLLTQANVDEAMAGLNAAKADEMKRLDTLATEYANTKRSEVQKGQAKYGDELSALVGGATDEASINKQRDAIENFDIEGRVTSSRNLVRKQLSISSRVTTR